MMISCISLILGTKNGKNKELEEFLSCRFENSEVDGRCFVYTGQEQLVFYEGKEYLFTMIGKSIKEYFFMSDLVEKYDR